MMNVPANDTVAFTCTGKRHQFLLKIGNIRNSGFYFLFNRL